jgi:uncharacterized protein (DUF433 family)
MEIGLDKLIEVVAEVRGGKPCLAGHRISVSDIAIWHYRQGMSAEQIAATYNVEVSKVYAALAYYGEHREDVDRQIEADKKFDEETRQKSPSLLKEKLKASTGG